MDKIKVLWMNNGEESYKAFITKSSLNNFNIATCSTSTECTKKIKRENWDAILLDAKPKRTEWEVPQSNNLCEVYLDIMKACNHSIPVFIVAIDFLTDKLHREIARKISGDRFYELQTSFSQLYEDIKTEVENNENYVLRKKYGKIYDFYMSINDSEELLMKLLRGLEDGKLYKDPCIPGVVRLILDDIMIYLNNENILPIKFTGSNLGECSIWLGDKKGDAKDIVPIHVQRCFHSCVEIANNGDHKIPKETDDDYKKRVSNPLYVQRQISDCKAPYLNKALIYDLLNILYWCATFTETEYES